MGKLALVSWHTDEGRNVAKRSAQPWKQVPRLAVRNSFKVKLSPRLETRTQPGLQEVGPWSSAENTSALPFFFSLSEHRSCSSLCAKEQFSPRVQAPAQFMAEKHRIPASLVERTKACKSIVLRPRLCVLNLYYNII